MLRLAVNEADGSLAYARWDNLLIGTLDDSPEQTARAIVSESADALRT